MTTVTMEANQETAIVTIEIYDDEIPEINEVFNVTISDPTGGAVLGAQSTLPVTILSNDDAHGTVGFKEVGLSCYHALYIYS